MSINLIATRDLYITSTVGGADGRSRCEIKESCSSSYSVTFKLPMFTLSGRAGESNRSVNY